jgi:AcrR family transcriptional regulator
MPSTPPPPQARPHTGRRRNESTRQAILDAAIALLRDPPAGGVTIDAIAAASGAGRQTIYRWWPSKQAMLAEAMAQRAQVIAPAPDTGTVHDDLLRFLTDTALAIAEPTNRRMLRHLMGAAQHDDHLADAVADFTARRRDELRALLERGQARGEVPADADLATLIDIAYGFMWYRMLVGHAPLDHRAARGLTDAVLAALSAKAPGSSRRPERPGSPS